MGGCCAGLFAGKNGPGRQNGGVKASTEKPIVVTIVGAAGDVGYALLPMIAKGDMFGPRQRLVLRCLDLNLQNTKEKLAGTEMELQDGNFPLLEDVVVTCKDSEGFRDADYALMLGAYPREGKSLDETVEKNAVIFRTMGNSLEKYASPDCKVLVVGSPAHVNALVCAHYAPKLPKTNFFTLGRLEQNRATGMVARRLQVPLRQIRNVLVFNSKGTTPDLSHASSAGKPLKDMCEKPEHRSWFEKEFGETLDNRSADVSKARKLIGALSIARSIVDQIADLHLGTPSGELSCLGVWSHGNQFGVDGKLFCTLPVQCKGLGRFQFAKISMGAKTKVTLDRAVKERVEERTIALEIFAKQQGAGHAS